MKNTPPKSGGSPSQASPSLKTQHGATAIEFAIMFPLFLTVFYGIVCYAVILLDKQALTTMASDAARAAIAATSETAAEAQIIGAIEAHAWIADRITGCFEGSHHKVEGDRLQICLQAEPVSLPTINLGIISLPPAEDTLRTMLRGNASVLWQPSGS